MEPVPVPRGDGRHDIGDDVRAAIVRRLMDEWSRDPDLTPEKVRHLAMWAGASVRALIHELGTLRDMADTGPLAQLTAVEPREGQSLKVTLACGCAWLLPEGRQVMGCYRHGLSKENARA